MHPKLLKELLLSFLGENSHDVYKEEFDIEEIEKLEGYLKSVENKPAASESGAEMGNLLEPLNNQAIKQFLQTVSIEDLAKVMSDLDGKAQVKLFNKLPKRGAFSLLDAIEHHDSLEAQEMEEAHEKIVVILNDLQNQASLQ
jgi:flagellar motor switch protein FliG